MLEFMGSRESERERERDRDREREREREAFGWVAFRNTDVVVQTNDSSASLTSVNDALKRNLRTERGLTLM